MEPASANLPAPPSRLRRLIRTLRNLTALGLLTLSFGVLALWVRSYAWDDQFNHFGMRTSVFSSAGGQLTLASMPQLALVGTEPGELLYGAAPMQPASGDRYADGVRIPFSVGKPSALNFGFDRAGPYPVVYAPHWFVALVFALLAFALKPKPRLKFSLADLLVLMTFSAVLIAGVAGLSRLGS
jgi:hypothetical protein